MCSSFCGFLICKKEELKIIASPSAAGSLKHGARGAVCKTATVLISSDRVSHLLGDRCASAHG